MRDRLISIAVAAIQQLLCQFLEICLNHEDCPDGVCDEARAELDRLDTDRPMVTMSPGTTSQSTGIDWQWDRLSEVSDAIRQLVVALRAFLGLDHPVG